MRMYQDTRRLDFHALGREIKRKREAKGWTQEYLAQFVDRTPRSIMYFENRGQHPNLFPIGDEFGLFVFGEICRHGTLSSLCWLSAVTISVLSKK